MRDQFGYFAFQNVAHFICFLYGSATMVPEKQVVCMVYLRGYISYWQNILDILVFLDLHYLNLNLTLLHELAGRDE